MIDTLYICGTVRDVSDCIKLNVELIDQFTCALSTKNKHWIIVESDSEDDTLSCLDDLSKLKNNFFYYSYGRLKSKIPLRTDRIAYCRNKYLQLVKDSILKNVNQADILMVVDFDNVHSNLDPVNFQKNFKYPYFHEWNASCCNSTNFYYDLWALRAPHMINYDCWRMYDKLKKKGYSSFVSYFYSVMRKHKKIIHNQDPIRVVSAFGGCALYKLPLPSSSKYIGIRSDGSELCEHVSLNKSIINNGGSIFIHPSFIVTNGFTSYKIFRSLLSKLFS
jgi:hypothetical protein